MTFQIVRLSPTYCQITDAMVGESAHPLPMSYSSVDLAVRIAARLRADEYEDGGDDMFAVVFYGTSALDRRNRADLHQPATDMFDDMPW